MKYELFYHERVTDYFRFPRCKGSLKNPDFYACVTNVSCGDEVILQGMVSQGMVTQCVFEAKGCVIAASMASMLAEYACAKPIAELLLLDSQFIISLIGMNLGPNRLQCALLSLEALHKALHSLTDGKK